MLIWLLFFFFISASLDLRCSTQDEVIKAIEKTKKYYLQSNFNSLTNQEGIILPIEKPPSCEAVSYSDTEVKQNDASLDCLLRNATEGDYIKYLLQPTGKNYVTTDWTLDMCAYEAIFNSLYSTLSKDEHLFKNYMGLDLKNQMLIYILENNYHDAKLRNMLNTHMAETLLLGGSLCTWVEKMNRTMTWGDLELIHVISYILKLMISILDFGGGTSNIATWHIGHQKSIKGVHVVLLYNRSTHFTGTGNILYWGTCNTFYTALKHNYRTLPNSPKLYRTFCTILKRNYQTLSNSLKPY